MIIREIPRDLYAAFVTNHPGSVVFHQVFWLEAVKSAYGIELFYLGVYEGEQLVGVLPVCQLRKFFILALYGSPLRKVGIPPAVPVLAPYNKSENVLRALDRWVYDNRVKHFQVTWPDGEPHRLPDRARIEVTDNLELDLSETLEAMWKGLSQQKAMVRRAVRQGVRVHWANSETFVTSYSQLLASTYDRQGLRPNIPLQMYREIFSYVPKKNIRILYATYRGRVIAAAWLLCSAERCHYWDAASLHEYRELSGGHLLVWEIIRWAKEKGFKVFDMVGTSIGGRGGSRPGIGRFKQSFGARPKMYHIIYWQVWWLKTALRIYRAGMNIINRLSFWMAGTLRRRDGAA